MFKKTVFCLFVFVLLVGTGNSFAQPEGFTIASPDVKAISLPEGTKLDLQNAADLTPEDLKAALEQSSCSAQGGDKNLDACYVCAGLNCGGPCYRIPCGFYVNAAQLGLPSIQSVVPGCSTTFVSTCPDLSSTPPCLLGAIPYPGSKVCYNINPAAQSVGCANPSLTDRE